MAIYKDFIGLNYGVYDPNSGDLEVDGINQIGYDLSNLHLYSSQTNPHPVRHDEHRTMVLLNLHRNGPYGHPSWKQIRASNNHLTRYQRKSNIFTYVEEHDGRFGETRSFVEPVVVDSYKPVSLVGEIKVYNDKTNEFQNRSVELKTSFGNETAFFANSKVNDYFETIAETDDNYEQMKDLYLDGGLEDEGSPIDSFNMFVYRQSIYPKQQYAYLDEARSRRSYENLFWRSNRADRNRSNVDGGFGIDITEQSIWPLDTRDDFENRTIPEKVPGSTVGNFDIPDYFEFDIGGRIADNSEGSPGVLQNRYSSFTLGGYYGLTDGRPQLFSNPAPSQNNMRSRLSSSVCYYRLHTLKNYYSPINPSGPKLPTQTELKADLEDPSSYPFSNFTGSLFNGDAHWDAFKQSGKEPFYDSYEDFSLETRVKGKGYTKIPEFKISNHVGFYLKNSFKSELPSIFEMSGGLGQSIVTTETDGFYEILSTSDFLKHFDLVKTDHKDLASEGMLTLKCKAVKKFLPYEGFYPAERTVALAKQFYESYKDEIQSPRSVTDWDVSVPFNYEQFATKPLIEPLFSPGILFNTIKAGVACDWPLIESDDYFSEQLEYNEGAYEHSTRTYANDVGQGPLYGGSKSQTTENNVLLSHTKRTINPNTYVSTYSTRIPFEALVEPQAYLANKALVLQEPHDFAYGAATFETKWNGQGDPLYSKMASNFLAEVPDFFLQGENFKTLSSLEEQSPEFGNAISGNFYIMRIKMTKSRNKSNLELGGYDGIPVIPPQNVVDQSGVPGTNPGQGDDKFTTRETLTMYSRPTAFGPPTIGDGKYHSGNGVESRLGSSWGYNFPYTPPHYHGESWCDVIFYAKETKKYTLDEIISQAKEYPYYTRYWHPSFQDAMRDLTGYADGNATNGVGKYRDYNPLGTENAPPWYKMITELSVKGANLNIEPKEDDWVGSSTWLNQDDLYEGSTLKWAKPPSTYGTGFVDIEKIAWLNSGPQSGFHINNNAMHLDSSVNLFSKGTIKTIKSANLEQEIEVASGDTIKGKTRWIIQSKFETPILNFNKYNDLGASECTPPSFAKSQVPRGMWHQYGDIPSGNEGIYLQVTDIPDSWLRGALGVDRGSTKIKSLADLVGFSKDKVRLGEVADVKEISEAVVAVPFIEKDGTRQFFSIPREDIDSCIESSLLESSPGTFAAGKTPKAGDSVYQMVKKMKKYVFPPSMDFVRYKEIDPFAMYIFEFKHNLSKQDLADIWQNLPPEIGIRMEEAEATISHELLAHELLGGGAVVKNGVLDDNAEGNGIPSNIQWMIFKAKKRAKTNYFDKVVAKKGTTADTSTQQLENAQGQTGDDLGITYNWPYDFFSLVELVKIDAEVTFANIENDDKGQKSIKKVERKPVAEVAKSRMVAKGINLARGKGKFKK
jgi:hypothetical protein